MSNTWLTALKKWNATQPKWTIPKKGTADYLEVRKLMGAGGGDTINPTKSRPVNGRRKPKKKLMPANGRRKKRPVGRPKKK